MLEIIITSAIAGLGAALSYALGWNYASESLAEDVDRITEGYVQLKAEVEKQRTEEQARAVTETESAYQRVVKMAMSCGDQDFAHAITERCVEAVKKRGQGGMTTLLFYDFRSREEDDE